MKTAADLIHAPAIEVWPDTPLRSLAELLVENDIGAALVRGANGGLSGVISERDVVRALAEGADPDEESVGDYMTLDVEFAPADATAAQLADTMIADAIRHLPIEDGDGKVLGVLSIRDVLAAVAAG